MFFDAQWAPLVISSGGEQPHALSNARSLFLVSYPSLRGGAGARCGKIDRGQGKSTKEE
jgi:hypothetical protein